MGGNWIYAVFTTLIVFVLEQSTDIDKNWTKHFLQLASLATSLQGFLVFYICVWSTKLREILANHLLPKQWSKKFVFERKNKSEIKKEESETAVELTSSTFYVLS
jgi:hypothetical protein